MNMNRRYREAIAHPHLFRVRNNNQVLPPEGKEQTACDVKQSDLCNLVFRTLSSSRETRTACLQA